MSSTVLLSSSPVCHLLPLDYLSGDWALVFCCALKMFFVFLGNETSTSERVATVQTVDLRPIDVLTAIKCLILSGSILGGGFFFKKKKQRRDPVS